MACKPKPQLRMADGGELMRRFANRQPVRMLDGTPENMAQNTTPMSAQDAGAFAAMGGPQGVAPDAPAAAPAADPGRRQRMLDAGQRTQTFMPTMGNIQTEVFDPHIRQLALRDGGTVPGKGTGDKIPALYEPGEFVVSNAMLDAEPGLREQLHDLRGNVLAAQGKSVEQADAQAVKGGNTLRAATGGPTDWMSRNLQGQRMTPNPTPMQSMADSLRTPQPAAPVAAPAAPKYTPPPVDKGTGRYLHEVQTRPSVVVDGGSNRVGNGGVNAGGGVAQPGAAAGLAEPKPTSLWGKTKAAGSAVGSGVKSVATGSILDADVGAAAGRALRGGASAAGSFANGLGRLALPVSMGATAAQMADTSTEEYAKRLDAPQDGSTLKDVGLRVMGGITDFNDMMTFGHASKLANWVDGKGYVDNETAGRSLTPAAPANTAQPAPAQPAPLALRGDAPGPQAVTPEDHTASDRLINSAFYNRPRTGMATVHGADGKPYEVYDEGNMNTLRMDGSSLKKYNAGLAERGAGIQVTKDANGQLRLSNSTGPEKLRYVGADGVPTNQYERTDQYAQGMQQLEAARATLRNPDGSTWSARDNAIMAANLRDGVDPYHGTSRAPKEEDRIPAIGEFGHNRAVAAKLARDQLKATLRGQDLDYGSKQAQNKVAMLTAQRDQYNKDREFGAGRADKGIEQASKFSEQARGAFKNKFDTVDSDGKPVQRPDLEAAAYDEAIRQSGGRWDQLTPPQRSEYMSDAFDHVKLLSSARNHQNNSIWQAVGLANKDAAHGGMPSAADMQGAKLTELGFGSGATTMNAGRGDYKLALKNGQVMHFGRGDLSQAQLKRLQDLGASLGDK